MELSTTSGLVEYKNGAILGKITERGPGRPPGALNKRSLRFMEVLEARGFCPATAMMDIYDEAKRTYDNYSVIYQAICDAKDEQARLTGTLAIPPEDKADKYLKIAADMAKDLATYSYPKLKAVEQIKPSPLENMTVQEKLDAAKAMVMILEDQAKRGQ